MGGVDYIFLSSGYLMSLQGLALSSLLIEFRARTCKGCIVWSWTLGYDLAFMTCILILLPQFPKVRKEGIMDTSNSLGSDEDTRYFFQ